MMVLLIVFAIVILVLVYKLRNFFQNLLKPSVQWKRGENEWAVVTGASDGIGLSYARHLGNKGYNLLLISRTREKLEEAKKKLTQEIKKPIEIRTLAYDFSNSDGFGAVEKAIKEIKPGFLHVLVNNVGISYSYPDLFTVNEISFYEKMININILACTRLCHLVLPDMMAAKRGIIINVSSISGSTPSPLLSVYSASKAYVDFFSRGLAREYRDHGVIVQSVLPAYVVSNMSKIRKPSFMIPTPNDYVSSALKTVGIEERTSGYFSHKLQNFVTSFLSDDLFTSLIHQNLEQTKKRYLKKHSKKD